MQGENLVNQGSVIGKGVIMKHLLMNILFTLSLPAMLHAQISEDWSYSQSYQSAGGTLYMQLDSHDNVFIAYALYDTHGIAVTKVNSRGTEEWSIIWSHPNAIKDVFYSIDNNNNVYILATDITYQVFIIKLSENGTVLWEKEVVPPSTSNMVSIDRIKCFSVSSQGIIYVGITVRRNTGVGCWPYSMSRIYLVAYNLDGDLMWDTDIGIDEPETLTIIRSGEADDYGNLTFTKLRRLSPSCCQETGCQYPDSFTINQYLQNGNSSFEVEYEEDDRILFYKNGTFYINKSSESIIKKYDHSGTFISDISIPGVNMLLARFEEDSYRNCYLIYDPSSTGLYYMDTNGDVLWSHASNQFKYVFDMSLDELGNFFVLRGDLNQYTVLKGTVLDGFVQSTTQEVYSVRPPYFRQTGNGNFYTLAFDNGYNLRKYSNHSLTVYDGSKNPLANESLLLIRVADDAPNYTEDTLGTVKTAGNGKIILSPIP